VAAWPGLLPAGRLTLPDQARIDFSGLFHATSLPAAEYHSGFPTMFPFWMEALWSSVPQVLTLLVASVAVFIHATTAHG